MHLPLPLSSLTPEEEPYINITLPSPKLGMIIARLPSGLYVRLVWTNSEAFAAGIQPGSMLVKVNGLRMLGETSHKALERLWSYEFGGSDGLLGWTGIGGNSASSGNATLSRMCCDADHQGVQNGQGKD